VQHKERVRKGQLPAESRSDGHRAAPAETPARVTEAGADVRPAEAQIDRPRTLREKPASSGQTLDEAERYGCIAWRGTAEENSGSAVGQRVEIRIEEP
jgi:hypothetical protein